MSEEPKLDAAKRPNGLRAMADGMIYLAGQTGVETANVWQTADILRAAACEMERLKAERDEARADSDEWQNKYAEVFVERDRVREALKRIADCDWVITLPDRMDAVRKIARDALEAAK